MKRWIQWGGMALAGFAGLALVSVTATQVQAQAKNPWPVKGHVLQEIAEFDNPEGSVFSMDGKSLFVSNGIATASPSRKTGATSASSRSVPTAS